MPVVRRAPPGGAQQFERATAQAVRSLIAHRVVYQQRASVLLKD